jgi:hypothetical protein
VRDPGGREGLQVVPPLAQQVRATKSRKEGVRKPLVLIEIHPRKRI